MARTRRYKCQSHYGPLPRLVDFFAFMFWNLCFKEYVATCLTLWREHGANFIIKDASGGWVGGDDSFYEYLIKMYVYDSTRFASYRDRWILAVDSSIAHLASHPSSRPDLTFLAQFNGQELIFQSEHCQSSP
jgi:Glycosyl hydrolase family 47